MSLDFKGWKDLMTRRTMAEKVLGQALKYLGGDTDKNAKYVCIKGRGSYHRRVETGKGNLGHVPDFPGAGAAAGKQNG